MWRDAGRARDEAGRYDGAVLAGPGIDGIQSLEQHL
jgi:hypothetical protein